jgi:cobalt-zinc-cadmium efflux system outer membrane protein
VTGWPSSFNVTATMPAHRSLPSLTLSLWALALAGPVLAQAPLTRAEAIAAALERGPRAAFARTDTAAAAGVLHGARLYPNPSVAASYTKDVPHYHVLASIPLDLPWLRAARIGAARWARDAARYGFAFERAVIAFEADTVYTRALATLAHAQLSRRNARDADSLLHMAELRRDVGDVSELDVRLAAVNAGQLDNTAASDSLSAVEALLELQLVMGDPAEEPTLGLADSLVPPPDSLSVPAGQPLRVAAASASLAAQEDALRLAHRNLFAAPSLQLGFDQGDPSGPPGVLPAVGVSLPLPLFNRNGGEVAQARAARDRAQANLALVTRAAAADLARARREFAAARARLARDRGLLVSADHVAAMSLQAYAEGAIALADVVEADRNAREALGRYIDDMAAADDIAAAIALLSATVPAP